MSDKPIYPDIEAIAEHDYCNNVFVVKDKLASGQKHTFTHLQYNEVGKAAVQDLLMRIDNFERSPTPPLPVTQAHVIHVRERNAVSVFNLDCTPSSYDFSAPQWRAICMVAAYRLVERLDHLTELRKQEKGV